MCPSFFLSSHIKRRFLFCLGGAGPVDDSFCVVAREFWFFRSGSVYFFGSSERRGFFSSLGGLANVVMASFPWESPRGFLVLISLVAGSISWINLVPVSMVPSCSFPSGGAFILWAPGQDLAESIKCF